MTARIAHVAAIDATHRFLLLPQLRALRDAGFDVTAISAPGPWIGDLTKEGIRFIPWRRATRSWDPFADLRAFFELIRLFRDERFDLVHTHNPKPGVLGRVAARLAGTPHVINTVHGYYATPDDRPARRLPVMLAEGVASRCSDLELFQSAEDLRWATQTRMVRPGRALHLGNGVDLTVFSPATGAVDPERSEMRRVLGFADDDVVVGTVGRMVREKGFEEFFEAARVIRRRMPHARFLAIGPRDAEKWDALTPEQLDAAEGEVTMLGWRGDVADLMKAMDVFVLASWREGMPRSAIEAAASGLPLVLTDIRGCREVIDDGREGILVPARDPKGLAGAILSLLEDAPRRAAMGRAARARAVARFDERAVCEQVVEVTRRLTASSHTRVPARARR